MGNSAAQKLEPTASTHKNNVVIVTPRLKSTPATSGNTSEEDDEVIFEQNEKPNLRNTQGLRSTMTKLTQNNLMSRQ